MIFNGRVTIRMAPGRGGLAELIFCPVCGSLNTAVYPSGSSGHCYDCGSGFNVVDPHFCVHCSYRRRVADGPGPISAACDECVSGSNFAMF